jgi:uncharacterized membrane protein YkvA (DUF1232 family)
MNREKTCSQARLSFRLSFRNKEKRKMAKREKLKRQEKLQLKSRMSNLLMFLPNLVALCFRLLADARVPAAEKALFAAAIVYAIVPLDFIPDILPFIGQVDDAYLIALTLLRLVNRTDEHVIRENWHGGGDIVQLADSVASLAPKLLPKRVNRIINARVKMAAADKILQAVTKRDTPLVYEISNREVETPPTK